MQYVPTAGNATGEMVWAVTSTCFPISDHRESTGVWVGDSECVENLIEVR